MSTGAEFDDIKRRIDDAIESLDDISYALLRQAVRDGGVRPSADKTLLQVRRALEKASRLLGGLSGEPASDGE